MEPQKSLATDKGYWEYPLISVIMVIAFVLAIKMYKKKHVSRTDLTAKAGTGIRQPCHPKIPITLLFGYRFAMAFAFLAIGIIATIRFGVDSFRFYTTWNFWAQCVYFCLISYYSYIRSTSPKHERTMAIYLSLLLVNAWIVTVVFWSILYPAKPSMGHFISVAQHGLNLLALLIEFALNSFVVEKHYGFLVPVSSIVFAVTTWIIHAADSDINWPYGFMEVARPVSPAWYAGILVAHVIFFFFVYGMSKLKEKLILPRTPEFEQTHGVSLVVKV